MTNELLDALLARLDHSDTPAGKWPDARGEYWAVCPFHADDHPTNFSVSERGYKCFACGAQGGLHALAARLGVAVARLHGNGRGNNTFFSLAQYARDKSLPEAFLRELGMVDRKHGGVPAVRIPYRDATGAEVAVRYRIAATGDKFRWQRNTKAQPYGLDRLDPAAGSVILVEGESDAQTLWLHGLPAVGIPGAQTWRAEWAGHFTGLKVYVWQEPDDGGRAFVARVGASLPDCLVLAAPEGRKDVSACHIAGDDVPALLAQLMAAAQPFSALRKQQVSEEAAAAKRQAAALLAAPDLLDRFGQVCRQQGLIGEERTARLLYLALTSRLLMRPVSVVVKGPSSGGKSFTVETVLHTLPPSAYYALSSMSERALAYSKEPLSHRFLVLYEAAGMTGEMATYLMRTLLSEGCIRYETVEKTAEGLQPKLIERPGPTGLIITTTAASLHPENETRLFSVVVKDTTQQTTGVLHALAARAKGQAPAAVDLSAWHALQTWLELAGCRDVSIPYAHALAALADARAVRLRRDFGGVLNLVRAHAILHQEQRVRDEQGRIVAEPADYAAVYELVHDLVAQGVHAAASTETREVVAAVKQLDVPNGLPVTYKAVGDVLGIDKSSAQRRCRVALEAGYLVNLQNKASKPAHLRLGDPLPVESGVIPEPEELKSVVTPPITVQPCNRSQGDPPGEAPGAGAAADAGLDEWQQAMLAEAEGWVTDPSY